ncbi:MAG: DUF6491 family protein [Alphaproteobacteria bacterium]|nr:DUF6491 family protein [Alphaproteobacteria bacterium]
MAKFGMFCLALAATAAIAGPVLADDASPAPKNSCAFVDRIYNFKEIDDYSAIIQTSPSRSYKVTFFNSCREMRWALFARVEARPGICLSKGDKIIVGRNGFSDRCYIDKVEALPPKARATPASNSY